MGRPAPRAGGAEAASESDLRAVLRWEEKVGLLATTTPAFPSDLPLPPKSGAWPFNFLLPHCGPSLPQQLPEPLSTDLPRRAGGDRALGAGCIEQPEPEDSATGSPGRRDGPGRPQASAWVRARESAASSDGSWGRLQRFRLRSEAAWPGGLAAWRRLCPQDPGKATFPPPAPQSRARAPARPSQPSPWWHGYHHLHLQARRDVEGWMSRITAHVPLAGNKQLTFWR